MRAVSTGKACTLNSSGFPTRIWSTRVSSQRNNNVDRHQLPLFQHNHTRRTFRPLRPTRDRPRIRWHIREEFYPDCTVGQRPVPGFYRRHQASEEVSPRHAPQLSGRRNQVVFLGFHLRSAMKWAEARRSLTRDHRRLIIRELCIRGCASRTAAPTASGSPWNLPVLPLRGLLLNDRIVRGRLSEHGRIAAPEASGRQ